MGEVPDSKGAGRSRKPGEWGTLGRRVGATFVIDLDRLDGLACVPPSRKLLLMIIVLALKDRASELQLHRRRSEGGPADMPMSYRVEGTL